MPSNTHYTVSKIHTMVLDGIEDERLKREIANALQIGGDQGHGTRYIGMGGMQIVEFAGPGAQKAAAYLYGIGAKLGVWDRLEWDESHKAQGQWQFVMDMIAGTPQEVVDYWAKVGKDYVVQVKERIDRKTA